MTTVSNISWTNWLNNHATRSVYDTNPTKIITLLTGSSVSAELDHLATNKNNVLLSRASLGKKVQATFYQFVVGIPIMSDSVNYVTRSGMKFGIGTEFQLSTMFEQTFAKAVPIILDMMNVTSETEFKELHAVTLAQKLKINCFAVITPSLAEAIQSSNMISSSIFIKIVEQIKVIALVSPESQDDADDTSTTMVSTVKTGASSTTTTSPTAVTTETVDQFMTRLGKVYAPILRFSWASEKLTRNITPPHLEPSTR